MTRLYTSPNLTEVELRRGLLEQRGIATTVRNQYLTIGRGDLPYTDTWPELWAVDDADAPAARAILDAGPGAGAEAWVCAGCGEENEGQFDACWNCSRPRPQAGT